MLVTIAYFYAKWFFFSVVKAASCDAVFQVITVETIKLCESGTPFFEMVLDGLYSPVTLESSHDMCIVLAVFSPHLPYYTATKQLILQHQPRSISLTASSIDAMQTQVLSDVASSFSRHLVRRCGGTTSCLRFELQLT